jgi:hypothetical protein
MHTWMQASWKDCLKDLQWPDSDHSSNATQVDMSCDGLLNTLFSPDSTIVILEHHSQPTGESVPERRHLCGLYQRKINKKCHW